MSISGHHPTRRAPHPWWARIRRMRAAGIHVPLIIDASGYGQDINGLQENGPYLIEADPDRNLMFSIHMWWCCSVKRKVI